MQIDLAALGITPEKLEQQIVNEAVDYILSGSEPYAGREALTHQAKEIIAAQFERQFAEFADKHVLPRIGEMIEAMEFKTTNRYGEAKAHPMTVREYIDHKVSAYLTEEVNDQGQTKGNRGGFTFVSQGTRLAVAIDKHIRYHLDAEIKKAFTDVNKAAAEEIVKAVRNTISRVRVAASVDVK